MADGKITIDTRLNNEGFKAGSKELLNAIKSLERTAASIGKSMQSSAAGYGSSMRNSIRAAREFQDQLASLERRAKAMRDALDKPGTGSKAYKAVENEIKQVEAAMDEAIKKRDSFLNSRGFVTDAAGFSTAAKQVKQYVDRLEELNAQRDRLSNPTKDDIAEYQQRANAYNQVAAKLVELRKVANEVGGGFSVLMRYAGTAAANIARIAGHGALAFLKKLASGAKNAAIQLAKLSSRAIKTGLKNIGQFAGNATKRLLGLGKSARKGGQGFKLSLRTLLKYGLGIRSMFVLFNRLRNAIKEGFSTLSQYDPRVKASLSSLKASLNGLKGSLAAAFAPILNAVAPALTTFIDLVTRAVNALGMFFAALTGQGYYSVAKGMGEIDSAASGASGSAKELKRQLAGFDELNILSANSGGGGSGAGGGGFTYNTVPIDSGIQHFVDDLKALFAKGEYEEIGMIIADGINGAIQTAQNWIKWGNIGQSVTQALGVITGTINGFLHGFDWENFGATIAEGLNSIVNGLILWFKGIDWAALGTGIGDAINGLFENVNWENIGEVIRRKVGSLITILKNAVTTIEWGNAGSDLADALNTFFKDEKIWADAGTTIDTTLKGLLTFGQEFIDGFDAKQAADDIKAALNKIDWPGIKEQFLSVARSALTLGTTFLKELFGQGTYNELGDAVEQMWERGSGNASSRTYSQAQNTSLAVTILNAIKWAIDKIPWDELGTRLHKFLIEDVDWNGIFTSIWDIFVQVFTGLGDFIRSLISGEETPDKGGTASTITGAASVLAVGAGARAARSAIGRLLGGGAGTGLLGGAGAWLSLLGVTGIAGLATGTYIAEKLQADGYFDGIDQAAEYLLEVAKDRNEDYENAVHEGRTYSVTGDGLKDYLLFLFGGTDALETTENVRQVGQDAGNNFLNAFKDKIDEKENLRNLFESADWLTRDDKERLGIPTTGRENRSGPLDNFAALFSSGEEAAFDKVIQHAISEGKPEWITALMDSNKDLYDRYNEDGIIDRGIARANLQAFGNKQGNAIISGLDNAYKQDAKMVRALEMLSQGKLYNEIADALGLSDGQTDQLRALEKIRLGMQESADETNNILTQQLGAALFTNNLDGILSGLTKTGAQVLKRSPFLLDGETPETDVKVNFVPQGMSPAFVNKPLAGLQSAFAPGADVTGRVNLTRNNFATVAGFVQNYQGGAVDKGVGLTRSVWSTVQGFVQGYMGGNVYKPVDLTRSTAWSTVQGFVGGFQGGSVYKPIDLTRSWWSTVQGFVQSYKGDNVAQGVYLAKDGWDWVDTWAKKYAQTAIEQRVVLKITDVTASSGVTGARIAINKAMGGIITAGGRSLNFASGGYLSGSRAGWWNSARKYASGTSRAHGTLFVAGEAGPEIVGHVGGRTEVLNKSQLAQTMYSAVTSGMISALRGITFTMPAMATGGIMPYEVSAQIAKSTAEINSTLNANNEDLIQTIISVAGQIVAALNRQPSPQPVGAGGLTAQQVINEINRQTLMFGASPLKGV